MLTVKRNFLPLQSWTEIQRDRIAQQYLSRAKWVTENSNDNYRRKKASNILKHEKSSALASVCFLIVLVETIWNARNFSVPMSHMHL